MSSFNYNRTKYSVFYPKHILKVLVLLSIPGTSILVFTSVIRNYVAHTYYSEYKRGLSENNQVTENQLHYLRNALKFSPSNAEYYFEQGRFYINEMHPGKNKSYGPAKEYFREALTHKPTDSRYWAEYAWYIGHSSETGKAIEYFNRAILLSKTDAYVHRLYARWCVDKVSGKINIADASLFAKVYGDKQKLDETLQSYDKRLINGVSITTLLQTARKEWDMAISLGTDMDKIVHNSLADLDLLRFEIDAAFVNYNRANNKIMQARCYFIKGDHRKDVDILGAMIKGGGVPLWENLTKIKKLLIDITKEDPKNYQAFYWLGVTYTNVRMEEKAIMNFTKAVKLKPGQIDTRLELAKLYVRTGKIDQAIEECETILSINPNHIEATRLLGESIREKYEDAEFMAR